MDITLKLIQMILLAEPAVVTAIHNLMSGKGTVDDLAVLKVDVIAWQAIADKAQAEIDKVTKPSVVVIPPTVS